jgi:hypothetical protein
MGRSKKKLCIDCKEAPQKIGERCEPCHIVYKEKVELNDDLADYNREDLY